MNISELDLSVRDFNAVKRFGINTTEELIERLPEFCLTARKTGAKVMEVLYNRGLLPFHLGEWVEPDRCGEELRPEEFQEGEFVIMGFPTESRDWRKVVLIEKIDGETLHYRDGSSGLPHTPIRARKVWRIAGERGQAPQQTELEALGVPKSDSDLLAVYDTTSLAEFKQHLASLCRACPDAVRKVYTALQNAGQTPFVPGDEPEDTDLIGEELSYSDLQNMPGELIVYADSEYDTPFIALITRVTDGTVWIWGDLLHPYSVTESEFMEDCKAFRIKTTNTPQSGTNTKEDLTHGNTENSGNTVADTDAGAASGTSCAAEHSTGTDGYPGNAAAPEPEFRLSRTDSCAADTHADAAGDSSAEPDPGAANAADSDAAGSSAAGAADPDAAGSSAAGTADPGAADAADSDPSADSSADVFGAGSESGGTSPDGIRQTAGTDRAARGVRRAVGGSDPGEQTGGVCEPSACAGRADLMPEGKAGCCPNPSGTPGVHAKHSPSHAAIWGTCTAALSLEANIPDTGSNYAAEGTLAHAIAELKLNKQFTPMPAVKYKNELGALKADPLYQPEMDGYTDAYVEEILKICHALPSKPYVVAEKRLEMGHIVPDCFGTADCVMLYGGMLHIFDFKYGKGVKVSADHNPQLRLYALGAVREYSMLYDIRSVWLHIIQPRLDNRQTEELSVEELTAWGDELRQRIDQSLLDGGEFAPGEHCRFCKAKNICRARAESLLTLEEPKQKMERGEVLTDEEIGDILLRAQTLANWVRGLEEYAQNALLQGKEIPGWKLVEGRSVRTISDIDKAFAELTAAGYQSDMLYERSPLGLTALEKLCGKKNLTKLIGQYIKKPTGKPTLAPESDKRKAFSKKKLEEMFSGTQN